MGSNVYQAHWIYRLEYRMLCSGLSYQRPYAKKCSNHLCFLSCTHNLLVRTTSSVSGPFPIQVFSNRKSWFLPKQRVPHWKYWCARCAFWFVINARRNLIILHYLKPKPLYTLTSVSIFSILFSVQFLWYWQGEFVQQSKLLKLVIICLILIVLMNDSAVFLWGEIKYWSLPGFKGLKTQISPWKTTEYL